MNNYISPKTVNTKKTTTYDVGNPGPDKGQAQTSDKDNNKTDINKYRFSFGCLWVTIFLHSRELN